MREKCWRQLPMGETITYAEACVRSKQNEWATLNGWQQTFQSNSHFEWNTCLLPIRGRFVEYSSMIIFSNWWWQTFHKLSIVIENSLTRSKTMTNYHCELESCNTIFLYKNCACNFAHSQEHWAITWYSECLMQTYNCIHFYM